MKRLPDEPIAAAIDATSRTVVVLGATRVDASAPMWTPTSAAT